MSLIVIAVVFVLMLAEARLSRVNERSLRALGASEPHDDVYPVMQWAYPLCFVAMGIEGALAGPAPGWRVVAGAAVFAAGKTIKYWAMALLGARWTFRVLVIPGAPLVTRGPYAWMRHPNYAGVMGEILGVALMVGANVTGGLSTVGFGVLLHRRIAVEERALGQERRS
ncbi:MAG: isoprenylcysteine carboxylmethyltransferase family protein [Vicinamibacterales bacterium]